MSFSRRAADTFYSRANGTLLTAAELSQPSPETVQSSDLLNIMDKFFDVGGNPGLLTYTWAYFANTNLTSTSLITPEIYLRGLLTLPLLWFQANGLSDTTITRPSVTVIPNLPSELYVTGSLAKSQGRIILRQWTVVVYLLLSLGVYIWCLAGLVWAMFRQGPNNSPFPLVDFASRICFSGERQKKTIARVGQHTGLKG
jgi:hypothetical protein